MHRFLISSLFLFTLFPGIEGLLGQQGPSDLEVGQKQIRESLQQLLDPRAQIQKADFERIYWLESVAEEYWFLRLQDFSPSNLVIPAEFKAASSQLRWSIEEKPWNLYLIASSIASIIKIAMTRPMHFISNSLPVLRSFLIPILFAILVSLLVYLSAWQPAVLRDLVAINEKSSPALLYCVLISILIFSLIFGSVAMSCLIAAGMALVYSRQKTGFLIFALILSFSMSLEFVSTMIERSASQNELREALSVSRNRVEYSQAAIANLSPLEKATLSFWNNDEAQTNEWLNESEDSAQKSELEAVVAFNPSFPDTTLRRLEELHSQYPQDSLIKFNLIQIYINQQKLVAAEELTKQLSDSEMLEFTQRSKATGQLLLPPEADSVWAGFIDSLSQEFRQLSQMQSFQMSLFILNIVLPWIVFFFFFALRNRGSGFCVHTGEATAHSHESQSRLAQVLQQKTELIDPSERQRYSQLARNYESQRHTRLRKLSWLFPFSLEAVEGSVLLSCLKASFLFSLIYWSLDAGTRFSILKVFNVPATWTISMSQVCWLFAVLAALIYVRSLWRAMRELD